MDRRDAHEVQIVDYNRAGSGDAVFNEIQQFAGIHCKSDRNDARSKVLGRGGTGRDLGTNFTPPCKSAPAAAEVPDDPSCIER